MSTLTLSSLSYMPREALAAQIRKTGSLPASTAIIDVRDSDHVGGHIRGSTWIPSQELDYRIPEMVRTLRDKDVVVFHCALSQQRGPGAALRYLRERERLESEGVKAQAKSEGEGLANGDVDAQVQQGGAQAQKVFVLTGGFTEWQEKYGADETLTEAWVQDIWEQ